MYFKFLVLTKLTLSRVFSKLMMSFLPRDAL